jgi:hypothetical protein
MGNTVTGSGIAVAGQVREIVERAPLIDEDGKLKTSYPQEDDGAIEPLPLTAQEIAQEAPESEFSGYVGLRRGQK